MTGIRRPLPIDPDTVRDHIDRHVAPHLAPDVSSYVPCVRFSTREEHTTEIAFKPLRHLPESVQFQVDKSEQF